MFRLFIVAIAGIFCGCSAAVDPLVPPTPAAHAPDQRPCTSVPVSPPYRFQLVTVEGGTTIQQALTEYSARGHRLRLADGPHLIFEKLPERERREAVASDDVRVTALGDLRKKAARLHGYRIADVETMVVLSNSYSVALLESSRKPDVFEYVIIGQDIRAMAATRFLLYHAPAV